MEKRIIRFGSGSNAIILPKKWLLKNRLKSTDTIFLNETSKGELVLAPKALPYEVLTKTIDKSTNPKILRRFVGLYYMNGISKLVIKSSENFTSEQMAEIQSLIKDKCPGFEIIGQSNNEMQIEDFTSIKELDIDRILSRIRYLINQEFIELKQGRTAAVTILEDLVDRFYMLGVRYVNMVQPVNNTKYYRTILLMEMISDNLLVMAPDIKKIDINVINGLNEIFIKSENGFKGDQKMILEVALLRNNLKKRIEKLKVDGLQKRLLREISKYSSHIAEFGLLEKDKSIEIF